MQFQLESQFQPTGDQPTAIKELVEGLEKQKQFQTLLGVTGSGKTFTMANVIQQAQVPTLIIAHNKTLAGQLYQEFRDFFPHNAVSYFVSYYDYYQPEAYIPSSDTYIEKEATINDEIDKLRLASTTNLLTRPDCIVIASVSCIYNLGSPVEFGKYVLEIIEGEIIARETLLLQLDNLQYQRADMEFRRGSYRLRGDTIQVWPASEDFALNIETLENKIVSITRVDPLTGNSIVDEALERRLRQERRETKMPQRFIIYPAKHYMMNPDAQLNGIQQIEKDLALRLAELRDAGKIVEAYRLEQKVKYDVDMIRELGFVNGIENYSRYFDGRQPGEAPYTLIEYFHENAKIFNKKKFLTIIDESHMSVPQIRGMYNGDQARKKTLIDYGFRLPSALDNRPLQFPEFLTKMNDVVFVSATPNEYEISMSDNKVVEQLIRPTGLLDPTIELRQTKGQIEDLIVEIIARKQLGQRTIVTTLTKKMAEALTDYLNDPEKVAELIKRKQAHETERAESDLSETVMYRGDQLPVDEMEIGPIDKKFWTRALIPTAKEFTFDLSHYPKVAYLHSDIETLERSDILDDLRRGEYDVVVGINLLREGLDLPEVTLVAILDADKEGFLRSATALIQTTGRAARHEEGHVIMYADHITKSMQKAIGETQRRRTAQHTYNVEHGITATTIFKPIRERMIAKVEENTPGYNPKSGRGHGTGFGQKIHTAQSDARHPQKKQTKNLIQLAKGEFFDLNALDIEALTPDDKKKLSAKLKRRMRLAANEMDFELAAELRDVVKELETK
jgi:excinuclease ABC subunit B